MKKLDYKVYLDKVRACWLGKNVGGTLGAPFECIQGVVDLDYYTHDISKGVLPNDDLDLQLVWLLAAEQEGKRVNAETLANYWLMYVVPDWGEYGFCKRNLRAGLLPSVSGGFHNRYRESNGAWIRSEIWACLAPGRPDIAVRYAYEDAIVDHCGEGVYAEFFCAAMQSAAFVINDMEKIIDIGLSYVPKNCDVAKAVRYVRELASDKTLDWKAARKKLLTAFPSSFGRRPLPGETMDEDIASKRQGYDAPSNIALMMLGHYFGEGDFSRAVCITAGCCEDSDCTAGTLAALYGIVGGTASIDKKWTDPIGDEIKTLCVDLSRHGICTTVSELTERVARLMPCFIDENIRYDEDGRLLISANDGDELFAPGFSEESEENAYACSFYADRLCITAEDPITRVKAVFDTVKIEEDTLIPIDLMVALRITNFQRGNWMKLVWHMPEGWEAVGGRESMFSLTEHWEGEQKFCTGIIPHGVNAGKYDVTLEIRSESTPSRIFIPFTFVNML